MGVFRQSNGGRWSRDDARPAPAVEARTTWPAFSVRQPWAWMAVQLRLPFLIRPYSTTYRGPVLLHASSVMTATDWHAGSEFARNRGVELPEPETLPRGGVVGIARLMACRRMGRGRWVFDLADHAEVPFRRAAGDFEVFELAGGRPCCMGCNTEARGAWLFCRSCGFPLGEAAKATASDAAPHLAAG